MDSLEDLQQTYEHDLRLAQQKTLPVGADVKRHTVSFSQFLPELLDREKYATTRQPRGIDQGDLLELFWLKNTSMVHRPVSWIGTAEVIEVIPWTLPESPDSEDWDLIYLQPLLRDCYWVETESYHAHGWTREEAFTWFQSHYGPGARLETIRFLHKGAWPSPREVLLMKRLYYYITQTRQQKTQKTVLRDSAWFSPDSHKKRL